MSFIHVLRHVFWPLGFYWLFLSRLVNGQIQLNVSANKCSHGISPYIYCINALGDEAFAKEISLPLNRWGGNQMTRYNYLNDMTNSGADYGPFANNKITHTIEQKFDSSSAMHMFDKKVGADTLVQVPMAGKVANDKSGTGAPDAISTTINAGYVKNYVEFLTKKFGTASSGGPKFYELDNEPDLWHGTHKDIRPNGYAYDELKEKSPTWAQAIKSADKTAQVAGPVVSSWKALFIGGKDEQTKTTADKDKYGPFLPWYLKMMKNASMVAGMRLLDYVDFHHYQQDPGGKNHLKLAAAGDATNQKIRLESTRSLWDPNYEDQSWYAMDEVKKATAGTANLQLIPRLKRMIQENYANTKLAITEYCYGGQEDITGALTQADVLGIFGREGLDLACYWDLDNNPKTFPTRSTAYAYRMFRNFDGKGSRFGDISLPAKSSNQSLVSVYAAQSSSSKSKDVTLMLINKSTQQQQVSVKVEGAAAKTGSTFQYTKSNLKQISPGPAVTFGADGSAVMTLPDYSITAVKLAGGGACKWKFD